jgi:hypothetical protein
MPNLDRAHPSHELRFSDASSFDFICKKCGHCDQVPGGWGALARPCPKARKKKGSCRSK